MILIVGLGNPGKKYMLSRHNLGFLVLNKFREKNNFPEFKLARKFNALISDSYLENKRIILAQPQIFMNLSGKAVKIIAKTYLPARAFGSRPTSPASELAGGRAGRWQAGNLKLNNLIVIHDDIDLPLGKIKIVKSRGAAGHKGVGSIIRELKTKNFIRFRVGIQPKIGKPKNIERFVLQKLSKAEEKIIKEVIRKTCLAIKMILKEGLEKAMAQYN